MTPEAIMTPGGVANGMGDIVQALAQLPVQLKQARLREAMAQRDERRWQAEHDLRKQDMEMRRQSVGVDQAYRQNTDRRAEEDLKIRQQGEVRQGRQDEINAAAKGEEFKLSQQREARQVRSAEIDAAMKGYAPKRDVTGTRGLFESYVNPYMQGEMPTGPAREYVDSDLGTLADQYHEKVATDQELARLGKETYARSITLQDAQAVERAALAKLRAQRGPILSKIASINQKLREIGRERNERIGNGLIGQPVNVGDLNQKQQNLEYDLRDAENADAELMGGAAQGERPEIAKIYEEPPPVSAPPDAAAPGALAPARSSAAVMAEIKARRAAGQP